MILLLEKLIQNILRRSGRPYGGLLMVLGLAGFSLPPAVLRPHQRTNARYRVNLARLDSAVAVLTRTVRGGQPEATVQAAFRRARLAYKRTEFLTEYYFPVSAKGINGPALAEGELDDGVGIVVDPDGMQVIEEMLFPLDAKRHPELEQRLQRLTETVASLRRVAGRNELADVPVFDALRLELFRVVTLGITGFDSPVARHSLPEAAASLESLRETVALYPLAETNPALAARLDAGFIGAIAALRGPTFNGFDRLSFIRNHANPLGRLLADARQTLGIALPTDKRFLKPTAQTLTDSALFNVMFFARYAQPEPTPERVALGKMLFYRTELSGDGQRTCATCHRPERAFTDGAATALALDGRSRVSRNTPTLLNAALQAFQFADSREYYLENQIASVIHNPHEMGGSLPNAVAALATDSLCRMQFSRAYPAGLTPATLTNALSSYIRSLVSLDTRVDRYLRGEPVALSATEKRGFNVFMGKGKCGTCHYFPIFNGTAPPAYVKTESEVLGTPATADERQVDADSGRFLSTKLALHHRSFKTPTLRHIGRTAPYMHNGAYPTLEQVVAFYNKGGGNGLGFSLTNQTLPADKLNLTTGEKKALVAFMKAL